MSIQESSLRPVALVPLAWRLALVAVLVSAVLVVREGSGSPVVSLDFPLRPQLYSFLVAWAVALSILILAGRPGQLRMISASVAGVIPNPAWCAAHVLLMAPVAWPAALEPLLTAGVPAAVVELLQVVLAAAAVGALLLALIPGRIWSPLLSGCGPLAWLSGGMALIAVLAMHGSQQLWDRATGITFSLVQLLLVPFYMDLKADAATRILDAGSIQLFIDSPCSGLEGVGLMLAFGLGWLWFLRREFRFPRALLLLPAGMLIIYLLNVVRIAVLFAIAERGHVDIALAGFHTQAGWIFFNATVFLIAILSRDVAWLRKENARPAAVAADTDSGRLTTAYLLPMLALLATGMLTKAVTGAFDRLYWLRLAAAGALLFAFRRSYRSLDWRFGWQGVTAGVLVFLIWLLAAGWLSAPAAMPQALLELSTPERLWWISTRALIASLAVPVVEELAFRGFLMRRLDGPDFDALSFTRVSIKALLISSVLFGLTHGAYWGPGIIAGLLFGAVAMRTGRFGDAVIAHAIANALLAAGVILFGMWQLW